MTSANTILPSLQYLLRRRRRMVLIEIFTTALCIAITTTAALRYFNFLSLTQLLCGTLTGGIVFAYLAFRRKLLAFGPHAITRFLNLNVAQLEQSSDLLLMPPASLPVLQQIQRAKTEALLRQHYKEIKFENNILRSIVLLAISVAVLGLVSHFGSAKKASGSVVIEKQITEMNAAAQTVKVNQIQVTIRPPAYTALPVITPTDLNLRVPEGAKVEWSVLFDGTPQAAYLVLNGKDSISLISNGTFKAARSFLSNGFYQLAWKGNDKKLHGSGYYKIEIIPDQPPRIAIDAPEAYTELPYTSRVSVTLRAAITDDYALGDARIVATVSKGSGESVKFREEILHFDKPGEIQGKNIAASRLLDLNQLGMEPGDELYFYVEATDNRSPVTNKSRTETFFIVIKGTTSGNSSFDTGMGVDLLPEYFRSQRQIIIDSEKLLEDKKDRKLTTERFASRSNDLAGDQKVLRLRYGQFMGEEAEGEGTGSDDQEREIVQKPANTEKEILSQFGHTHDTENEHNQVPMFEQSIRAKLKAALAMMWDAELHLRLNDPAKSLPFQYKILRLLKEISNDSRVYVRRTGFDPPPVKEDKRLKGDLTEIQNRLVTGLKIKPENFPAIREAIAVIEKHNQEDTIHFTEEERVKIKKAGAELANEAIQYPGNFLRSLSELNNVLDAPVLINAHRKLTIIQESFWKIVPKDVPAPAGTSGTIHQLDNDLIHASQAANQ